MKRHLSLPHLLIVIALLLVHFAIRAHHPTLQNPYVDEGFHIARALKIYDFEVNPARFAHGKLLLYFWLGLFDTNDPATMLPVSRLAIAISSVVAASGVYLLGRLWGNARAGLIALAIYSMMPHGVFYERMAMADPFAASWMVLAIWRMWVFARRPSLLQGAIMGLLITLATMAKLTMGLLVLLPLLAIVLYGQWRPIIPAMRRYAAPAIVAAGVFLVMWSPFAVPAYLERNSDDPFIFVNAFNIDADDSRTDSYIPIEYLETTLRNLDDFLLPYTIWVVLGAFALTFWQAHRQRIMLFAWLLALVLPMIFLAHLVSIRYFMPTAVPLALMVGLMVGYSPKKPMDEVHLAPTRENRFASARQYLNRVWRYLRWGVGAVIAAYALFWAIPFVQQTITNPLDLPFEHINYTEYTAGYLTGDAALQQAAQYVNLIEDDAPIYADWNTCHKIFFFVERDIHCFDNNRTGSGLRDAVRSLAGDESMILIIHGYQPFYDDYNFLRYETIIQTDHERIRRPVRVLRMFHTPNP